MFWLHALFSSSYKELRVLWALQEAENICSVLGPNKAKHYYRVSGTLLDPKISVVFGGSSGVPKL